MDSDAAAPRPKSYKTPKHASCFDRPAAEPPYMFIGALQDGGDSVARVVLDGIVKDCGNVDQDEALNGWGVPPEDYYRIAEPRDVVSVSRAAYAFHKASVRSFKASIDADAWQSWERIAATAEEKGVQALIHSARAAATLRDSRRLVLQNALYFAGLALDEAGLNTNAWALRDNKARNAAFIDFVRNGPADHGAMSETAAAVAARIAQEHVATGGAKRSNKRKREPTDSPEASKKARRAALLTAFMDAGVPHTDMPQTAAALTDAERAFLDEGPLALADVLDVASNLATQRFVAT